MRIPILLAFLVFVLGLPVQALTAEYEVKEISYLSITSAITPATLDYLQHQFSKVPDDALVVIKMNTPGGLVTTTKDIITLIGKQDFPVAVWITPEGASASSAGAIIASAAHFILMAPGTNMGAATPIGMGEDIKESDARKKALNDLSALVRSLSESRGRPAAPFEEMITEATSFTDKEATKLKIIDGVASSREQLEKLLAGKSFVHQGTEYILAIDKGTNARDYEPTLGQQILDVIANPSTAYFLFLIGVALIYLEFQAPGGFIAGTVGVVFLILAAVSFQVLPLNWGALGLIILGLILLVMEIFITSYGILTLAGLGSFIAGSLFLFHGEGGFISIEYPVMFSTLAGVLVSVGIIVWYLVREDRKQKRPADFFLPVGSTGTVMTMKDQHYQVKVKGETWRASSPEPLSLGDHVEVVAVDPEHLTIQVKKSGTP